MAPNRMQEGSVFFTENKFYNNILHIPNEYEMPLFVNKRLKLHKEYSKKGTNYISNEMKNYKKYHKTCENHLKPCPVQEKKVINEIRCDTGKKLNDLNETKTKQLTLPPNRYTIKGNDMADIVKKQMGKKGPYACFSVPRTDVTCPGHFAARKFKGSLTLFYNIPSEMKRLLHPRKYFVMKIRKMPIKPQRPYLRCMLTDITLCWRNPNDPGPNAYFPKNNSIGAVVVKQNGIKAPKPIFFYPRTTVPVLEHSYVHNNHYPGPERYRPDMIACPCMPGYTYDENILYKLTLLKRKRFGYKHYLRLLNKSKLCSSGRMRNIPGHGHRSVFISKTFRLVEKMPPCKAIEREKKLTNSREYFQKIQRPKRTPLSHNLTYLIINRDRKSIFFNTTQRKRRRVKLKTNKKVAFSSAMPRFIAASGFNEVFLAARPKDFKEKKTMSVVKEPELKKRCFSMGTMQRLIKLPERYESDLKNRQPKEAVFNFQPLPQPKAESDDDNLSVSSSEELTLFKNSLDVNEFLENKYLYGSEISDFTNDLPPTRSQTIAEVRSVNNEELKGYY